MSALDHEAFVQGYLDAILFTEPVSFDDDTSLLSHGITAEDFTAEARREATETCEDFIASCLEDLEQYCEARGDVHCRADSFGRTEYSASECAGADFWLSRNGHGAGYFDRGNEPVFTRLQDAAWIYGEASVYFDGVSVVEAS